MVYYCCVSVIIIVHSAGTHTHSTVRHLSYMEKARLRNQHMMEQYKSYLRENSSHLPSDAGLSMLRRLEENVSVARIREQTVSFVLPTVYFSSIVTVYFSSIVTVYFSSTVTVYFSSTVTLYFSPTVTVYFSPTVTVYFSPTVTVYFSSTVTVYFSPTYFSTVTVA